MRYTEIFKEARRLHDLGFAIHWLHPRSKRPVDTGWTTGPRHSWKKLDETYTAGLNVGVRLGTPSVLNGLYLAVIDCDVKSTDPKHRKEMMAKLRELFPALPKGPVCTSGRGNGSMHVYVVTDQPLTPLKLFTSSEEVKCHMPSAGVPKKHEALLTEAEIEAGMRIRPAWEIGVMGEGQQVVLPPSVHPDSGELYQWKVGFLDGGSIPYFGGYAFTKSEVTPSSDSQSLKGDETSQGQSEPVIEFSFEVSEVKLTWLGLPPGVQEAIESGEGVEDRSGYLLRACQALLKAGLERDEVLSILTDPKTFLGQCAYDHAKTKNRTRAAKWVWSYTLSRVMAEQDVNSIYSVIEAAGESAELSEEEKAANEKDFGEDRHWKQELTMVGKSYRANVRNVDLILSNAVDASIFIKDVFANRIEYGADAPWGRDATTFIEDIDLVLVKCWLMQHWGFEPSTSTVLEAIGMIAHRKSVHPVKEWLGSLAWDGKPRIDSWIRDYCQSDAPEPYLAQASRKFLLSMVKRIFEPGCQCDYVLVLEGRQGKFKSSAARALASDKWFMDNLPDLKDKDAMLNLQGKWLIELGELASVKRTDYNMVKAYLSRRTDTVRPHYGRISADVPRQSVFIGTVNEGQYFKDPTGNRRYWPVKVGACDVPGLLAVRDQLFAEAVHVHNTTEEKLMLEGEAEVQATEAQEERRIDDDETEMREAFIDHFREEFLRGKKLLKFRTQEMFSGSGVPWARWEGKSYASQTAAQVLRNLHFERIKIKGQRVWKAPENLDHLLGGRPPSEGADPLNEENVDFSEMDFM